MAQSTTQETRITENLIHIIKLDSVSSVLRHKKQMLSVDLLNEEKTVEMLIAPAIALVLDQGMWVTKILRQSLKEHYNQESRYSS